jgi:hypothetical protein
LGAFIFISVNKMSGKKLGRVPVLEDAFEINLAKLLAVSKRTGQSLLKVDDGTMAGEVLIRGAKLAVRLAGQVLVVAIVAVPCLKDRVRPCLNCPRAHEGNFQSLYYWNGELACRHCHRLRYRSNLAASATERARLARFKLLTKMGAEPGQFVIERQPFKWRKRHQRLTARLTSLTDLHYRAVRAWLGRRGAA